MQSTVHHVDPQSDPHDDIVAILRSEDTPRAAPDAPALPDASELHISLAERAAAAVAAMELPRPELALRPPVNDNVVVGEPLPAAKSGGGLMRFVLTVCFGIAVTIAWQAWGDTARQMFSDGTITNLVPQLAAVVPAPAQGASEQPAATPVQSATDAVATSPAAVAPPVAAATPPETAVPGQAAAVQATPSQDLAPLIEGLSHEVAALKQTIEQLKASQQQLTRDLARAEELRRKAAAPSPKQAAAAPLPPPAQQQPQRMATPMPPPPQSPYQPQYVGPPQPPMAPDYAYVPRPPRPMP